MGCKNPSGFIKGTQAAKDRVRSRITQGKLFAAKIDCRSLHARRFKSIVDHYTQTLGGNLAQWQQTVIRQIATLTLHKRNWNMPQQKAKGSMPKSTAD